jgi:hypothetical protein
MASFAIADHAQFNSEAGPNHGPARSSDDHCRKSSCAKTSAFGRLEENPGEDERNQIEGLLSQIDMARRVSPQTVLRPPLQLWRNCRFLSLADGQLVPPKQWQADTSNEVKLKRA